MVPACSGIGHGFLPRLRRSCRAPARANGGPLATIRAIAGLLDKQIVFVTGKGGAGKSTIAYAIGLASAARGRRTIVCEIAGQERGAALFDREPVGFAETELTENLWTISIDPDDMVREYLAIKLPMKAMASVLTAGGLFNYLAAATPGLAEMVTLGKIWELAQDERRSPDERGTYDRVIVDAPASGHAIGLLRTPRTFREIARMGPLAKQAGVIERGIADEARTGVAIVTTPEEIAVSEAGELVESIGDEVAIDLLICNALLPERFTRADVDTIEAASHAASDEAAAALQAALAEARLGARQRRELARLCEAGAGRPVLELGDVSAGSIELGLEGLRRLAEAIGERA